MRAGLSAIILPLRGGSRNEDGNALGRRTQRREIADIDNFAESTDIEPSLSIGGHFRVALRRLNRLDVDLTGRHVRMSAAQGYRNRHESASDF
jgi:hypothetical protein